MSTIFLMIDFQNVFGDRDKSWYCPEFYNALNTAMICKDKLLCKTIVTAFIPPNILQSFDLHKGSVLFNPIPIQMQRGKIVADKLQRSCDVANAWKTYFLKYPDIPTFKFDPCYDFAFDVSYTNVVESATFGKWNAIVDVIPADTTTVYVSGVSTDCCVLATVLAAIDAGLVVYVIEDACASGNNETHQNALNTMKNFSPNVFVIKSSQL